MKKLIKGIWRTLNSGEQQRCAGIIIINALLSIADIISIAFIFLVLNIYSGEISPLLASILKRTGIEQHSILPVILLVFILIIKNAAAHFISKVQFRFVANVSTRLTRQNLLFYLEGSYNDHVNIDSSMWMRRICFQPMEFAQFELSGLQQVINESILILILITALIFYSAKLLLIVLIVLLPAIVLLLFITKRRLKKTKESIKIANERSLQYLNEAINSYVESNIYNRNDFLINRYAKESAVLNRFIADMFVTQAMPNRIFEVSAILGLFVLIIAAKTYGNESSTNIILMGAFVAAAYKIIPGISKIISIGAQIKTYAFTVPSFTNKQFNNSPQNEIQPAVIEKIEFRNVVFSYNENIVFKNLNCCFKHNSFIGISGNSGKGKTTLTDLVLGFLSPQSGDIFFNGKQVHANDIKDFWPQIAYAKQSAFLLHDSVLNNITLYKDFNKERLNEILEITGLSNWINELPDGINTTISESGKNISGGQRQRIAVARALFKDANIIILDEPFNELDEASEISLLEYFKQLKKEKMIVLITHNSNSFSYCDNVIHL